MLGGWKLNHPRPGNRGGNLHLPTSQRVGILLTHHTTKFKSKQIEEGSSTDLMGGQQSKEASLHQHVVNGNIEGVKALHREGANLEWFDNEGKTALIVACMHPQLYHVAKTLIDLGANINAFRTGNHGGTALHHAVKMGLDHTVILLLSHGANALAVNDDGQTALDVARAKGFSSIVRTIESHICYFSGWLRELYGPGFLEALVPQLLSRQMWIVVVPSGSRNRRKPLKLQLAMYTSLQEAQPRTTITLWKAKIEEPNYHQQVPVLSIFDKDTRTRYKLTHSNEAHKQQLQWLCNACRGIPQVTHPTLLPHSHTPTVPQGAPATSTEDVELAMAINASLLSAMEERPPINDSHVGTGDGNPNGWGASSEVSSHNGWLSIEGPAPSQASSSGWLDRPPVDAYIGWGASETGSTSNPTRAPPDIPETTSNSSANSTKGPSHNGWGPVEGSESSSKESSSGWLEKPAQVAHNGWLAGETGSSSSPAQNILVVSTTHTLSETAEGPKINVGPETALVPSAPSLSGGADDGPIQYPSIDFSPIDLAMPYVEDNVTKTNPVKEDVETSSSSCVVCLDAPVEGACVPCGHMAGCMSCLSDIKAKKWGCPVCRSKIDQVIRLFAV